MATSAARLAAVITGGVAGVFLLAGAAGGQPAVSGLANPLTLLQIMRANVEIPADGVWGLAAADKLSDDEWLLAEQDAVNIVASASLIAAGGAGSKDKGWAAHADYQAWAKDVQDTGVTILAAVKAKDLMKVNDAANHLNDTCQACHDKYRPETPSDGIARFPFYPARALKK